MERYYISIPDPTPTPEGFQAFRKDQFVDIVRIILCSFYDDPEVLVANFLLESEIAFTDQQIAEVLSLPQRQVRAILEARLCKDFITEAEVPNVGSQAPGSQTLPYAGGSSAWYRINPNILSATWYRLTQTERGMMDKLKSVQESESYICQRCGGREFDSLRAVSLFSSTDGLFHCDICDDVLHMRQNKQLRERTESLLSQFRTQFESIKERLESMNKMFVPRPIVIKKTVHEKLLEQSKAAEAGMGGDQSRLGFSNLSSAVNSSIAMSSLADRREPAAAPEWIREAQQVVTGGSHSMSSDLNVPGVGRVETKRIRIDNVNVGIVSSQQDVKTIIESAANLTKKEEIKEIKVDSIRVTVAGMEHDLEEVKGNESLIERMTDEEYMSYDTLLQSLGFR